MGIYLRKQLPQGTFVRNENRIYYGTNNPGADTLPADELRKKLAEQGNRRTIMRQPNSRNLDRPTIMRQKISRDLGDEDESQDSSTNPSFRTYQGFNC